MLRCRDMVLYCRPCRPTFWYTITPSPRFRQRSSSMLCQEPYSTFSRERMPLNVNLTRPAPMTRQCSFGVSSSSGGGGGCYSTPPYGCRVSLTRFFTPASAHHTSYTVTVVVCQIHTIFGFFSVGILARWEISRGYLFGGIKHSHTSFEIFQTWPAVPHGIDGVIYSYLVEPTVITRDRLLQ